MRATRYPAPTHPRWIHGPNEMRVPGEPHAAGSIFTRSSASFTPNGDSGAASENAARIDIAQSRHSSGP